MDYNLILSVTVAAITVVATFVTNKVQLAHLVEKVTRNEKESREADDMLDKKSIAQFKRIDKQENDIIQMKEQLGQLLTVAKAEEKFVTKEVLELKLKNIKLRAKSKANYSKRHRVEVRREHNV